MSEDVAHQPHDSAHSADRLRIERRSRATDAQEPTARTTASLDYSRGTGCFGKRAHVPRNDPRRRLREPLEVSHTGGRLDPKVSLERLGTDPPRDSSGA